MEEEGLATGVVTELRLLDDDWKEAAAPPINGVRADEEKFSEEVGGNNEDGEEADGEEVCMEEPR